MIPEDFKSFAAPVFERPRALPPRPAPPPRPAAAAVPRSPRANLGNDDWRDRLVTWARTPGAPLPALDETPLGELAARGVAGTAGWPMLCALYAGWLDGDHGSGDVRTRVAGEKLDRRGHIVWRARPVEGDAL